MDKSEDLTSFRQSSARDRLKSINPGRRMFLYQKSQQENATSKKLLEFYNRVSEPIKPMDKRGKSYFIPDNNEGAQPRRPPQRLNPGARPKSQVPVSCRGQVNKNVASVDQGMKLTAAKGTLIDNMQTPKLVGIVTGILNKLSKSSFATLMHQVVLIKIDTEVKLREVADLIYEKAINEPESSEACANMCRTMTIFRVETNKEETIEFRKVLLAKCQREFEKNRFHEEQLLLEQKKKKTNLDADRASQLRKEYELAKVNARGRKLGNIRFIGELFKLRMLKESIMHNCIVSLLEVRYDDRLELLCRLLTMIGKDLDHDEGKQRMDRCFEQFKKFIQEKRTSPRVRFMLQDVYDLRLNKWVPRAIMRTTASPTMMQGGRQQKRMGSRGHVDDGSTKEDRQQSTMGSRGHVEDGCTKVKPMRYGHTTYKLNQFDKTRVTFGTSRGFVRPQKQVAPNSSRDLLGPASSRSSAVRLSNEGKRSASCSSAVRISNEGKGSASCSSAVRMSNEGKRSASCSSAVRISTEGKGSAPSCSSAVRISNEGKGAASSCYSAVRISNEGKGSSVHKATAKCTSAETSTELQTCSADQSQAMAHGQQMHHVAKHQLQALQTALVPVSAVVVPISKDIAQTESIHVPLQVSSCAQASSQMAELTLKQQEPVQSSSANSKTGEPAALHDVPHKEDSKSDRMSGCPKIPPKEDDCRPSTSKYEYAQWKAEHLRKPDTSYNKNTADKEDIYGLVCYINNQSDYLTTNSRSGQILVCSENSDTGIDNSDTLYYTSSTTANSNNVIQALKDIEGPSKLVFQPFSLDVQCRTLESTKILLKAAVLAGLQNPGISFENDEREIIIVFIRGLVSSEVLVTNAQGKRLTSDPYIEYVTEVANKKLADDLKTGLRTR